jgi:hypothetical protein
VESKRWGGRAASLLAYRRRTRTRPLPAFTTYTSLGTMRDDEALEILAAWRCPTDYPYAFVGDAHESSQFANVSLSMNACHFAGRYGRVDILNWLKDKGAIDGMINQTIVGHMSPTPLMKALLYEQEKVAVWLVDNGADTSAIDGMGVPIYLIACQSSSAAFVQWLAEKVPPEHLTRRVFPGPAGEGASPTSAAFQTNSDRVAIAKLHTIRGAMFHPYDFPSISRDGLMLVKYRRQLLKWVEAELATHRVFINVVLVCGVYDPMPAPQNRLAKLRGYSGVCERIARYLGVRTSAAERERIKNLAPILRWAEVHWLRFKECYMIQTGAPPDDELVYALPDVVLIYLGLVKPPFNGSYEWQPTHHHHFQYPPVGG